MTFDRCWRWYLAKIFNTWSHFLNVFYVLWNYLFTLSIYLALPKAVFFWADRNEIFLMILPRLLNHFPNRTFCRQTLVFHFFFPAAVTPFSFQQTSASTFCQETRALPFYPRTMAQSSSSPRAPGFFFVPEISAKPVFRTAK